MADAGAQPPVPCVPPACRPGRADERAVGLGLYVSAMRARARHAAAVTRSGYCGTLPDAVLLDVEDVLAHHQHRLPRYGVQVVWSVGDTDTGLEAGVLKSDTAVLDFPELGVQAPAGCAKYTTLRQLLLEVCTNLERGKELAGALGTADHTAADGVAPVDATLAAVRSALDGCRRFTAVLTDPLGLSYVCLPPAPCHRCPWRVCQCAVVPPQAAAGGHVAPLSVDACAEAAPSGGATAAVYHHARPFETRLEWGLLRLESSTADLAEYVYYLTSVCDWEEQRTRLAQLVRTATTQLQRQPHSPPQLPAFHAQLYPLRPLFRRRLRAAHARHAAARAGVKRGGRPPLPLSAAAVAGRPLRVGYLGSTFRNDPVGHLCWDLFRAHSRVPSMDAVVFGCTPHDGSVYAAHLRATAPAFVDVSGMSDADAAAAMAAHRLDVVVEMSGYTSGARLGILAHHVAPIQVMHAAAYPASTGAPYITHMLADAPSWPPLRPQPFCAAWPAEPMSEAPALMPGTFFVNSLPSGWPVVLGGDDLRVVTGLRDTHPHLVGPWTWDAGDAWEADGGCPMRNATPGGCAGSICVHGGCRAAAPSRLAQRRLLFGDVVTEGTVVLACLSQLSRVDSRVFELWVRVLVDCPAAVLVLLALPVAAEELLRRQLRAHAAASAALSADDVHALDKRLVFVPPLPKMRHIERAHYVDLLLDTPHRNGHTVTVDVLWAGTPVVTAPTNTLAGRVVSGLLHAVNLSDWVCDSFAEYEARVEMAVWDPALLVEARHRLTVGRRTSPLFDMRQYLQGFEQCMRALAVP